VRDVRDVFILSASANLATPSNPILISTVSENEMKASMVLQLRSSEVREVFDLSTSNNLLAMKQVTLVCYCGEQE
jgi:hypothetical protein